MLVETDDTGGESCLKRGEGSIKTQKKTLNQKKYSIGRIIVVGASLLAKALREQLAPTQDEVVNGLFWSKANFKNTTSREANKYGHLHQVIELDALSMRLPEKVYV